MDNLESFNCQYWSEKSSRLVETFSQEKTVLFFHDKNNKKI